MHILETSPPLPPRGSGWAPLALGFRPFFLLAALASVALMSLWLLARHGHLGVPAHYDPVRWHAHEMLLGYTAGMIALLLLIIGLELGGLPSDQLLTTTAFVIIHAAVVVRAFGPVVLPANHAAWVDLSGGLWVLAFALFAFDYTSLLMRPRTDGKPG